MKKRSNSQSGFGAVGLILLAIVLVALGAAGWIVYQKRVGPSSTSNTNNTNNQTATTPDSTADWKRVVSIGGAYSIKVPDGWELTNYPGNALHGDDITLSAGKPAVITT